MRIAHEHIISNNALLTKNRCGDAYHSNEISR